MTPCLGEAEINSSVGLERKREVETDLDEEKFHLVRLQVALGRPPAVRDAPL